MEPPSREGIAARYPLSVDGLRRLHLDIAEQGERAVGLAAGHPFLMAAKVAHHRLRELQRELGIHDLDAIPTS